MPRMFLSKLRMETPGQASRAATPSAAVLAERYGDGCVRRLCDECATSSAARDHGINFSDGGCLFLGCRALRPSVEWLVIPEIEAV